MNFKFFIFNIFFIYLRKSLDMRNVENVIIFLFLCFILVSFIVYIIDNIYFWLEIFFSIFDFIDSFIYW